MSAKTSPKETKTSDSAAGTYVYDAELGKVVKVSDRLPKVASKRGRSSAQPGPCGRSACGGGRCAGN